MLFENVLPHCMNTACKIFLLKAVLFSNNFACAWLSLAASFLNFSGSNRIPYRVRPDKQKLEKYCLQTMSSLCAQLV